MYNPSHFREERREVVDAFVAAQPFGLLVSQGGSGLQATPAPFLLYPDEGAHGTLRAHFSRANPHWRDLAEAGDCLVVFQGPHGYVTPSWYPSKAGTHRVVPTWNYAIVQAKGRARAVSDTDWLSRLLADLTARQERVRPRPWAITDAPADYIAGQMKAIVGVEIAVEAWVGKWKMSQNKDAADRAGVVAGLRSDDDPHGSPVLAGWVERGAPPDVCTGGTEGATMAAEPGVEPRQRAKFSPTGKE